ncbi:MAG: AMP-binding protein, partial [Solirubrobacterales bacterium]|nr:AMP-binding protein [Solirubrobacterales bacterium]
MGETTLTGLMMDDYPLSLTGIVERAELLTPEREVVYRRPDGKVHRTTMGECAKRARRLAGGLAELGIGAGDRVGTLMWNQPEHLEAYYGVPLMGAVIHTLNPRLHPDELAFIAEDAEDKAIIVDESLLGVLDAFRDAYNFDHVIVVSHSGEIPDGARAYAPLIDSADPVSWPDPDERRACAICYTSGT